MKENSIKENAAAAAMRTALNYINGKNPDEAIERVMEWIDRFDSKEGTVKAQMKYVHEYLSDKDGPWYKFVKSFWNDIDPDVREKTFENFIINATILGGRRKKAQMEKYGCNIPWTILIDPTSACHLHCTGCWAAEYGNKLNLSYETIDSIINQANDIGTRMFLFSGGEPLVRKEDIIRLCKAHPDSQFMAFTNGTLIDDNFAKAMLEVKNFIPAISVEGFEEATDFRRGNGTFKAVERAMRILREHKLPFGVSCCYTHQNVRVIGSEEYFDWMIGQGAKFAWFFTYVPVGVGAPTNLMADADDRAFMYERIREYRKTKPIFTMDFWNDGEYVKGCIAGGRYYFHINANGDAEPCAFIHYSNMNIKEHTLIEVLQSPLFKQYASHQPFSENYLRPCPLLDNYGALSEMVHAAGATSTDLAAKEDVDELCSKCKNAAENWKKKADSIWSSSHPSEII